ncbi:putative aldehyde reductase i [Naematelia encephala]|uniref:Putative aldehyde reductase i n=1 Tax=Naematelia encephala TaxID=71784 RepID=A0A1Y2BAT0_9TREE|nr:putative aldehyde reductase i [Naematelia encephala]
MATQSFKLNNGLTIPSIGLGTWQSPKGEVAKAVEAAIKVGYRHIDCAWGYQNEDEVGEGIKASGVPREELWLTSKLFEFHHKPEHVELALRDTLKKLDTPYLDLYLMHWNIAFTMDAPEGELPVHKHLVKTDDGKIKLDKELTDNFIVTWQAMEKLVEKGLVKSIGISNFNIHKTKQLLAAAKIKPVANQVELSIQCPQPELVAWLKKNDILPQAYSPLGGTDGQHLREHKDIVAIAQKHKVHGATVLLSWLLKRGICPLPKSVTPSRIEANFKTIDLSSEEFETLEKLAEGHPPKRVCDQSDSLEPYYDIYQENDPEYSDKVQFAKE